MSETLRVSPPLGAVPDSETVQLEVPGAFTVAGVQDRLLTADAAFRDTLAVLVCPFQFAVRVAVWELDTVPAVALNVPLLEPAPMVILDGTLSWALLLDRLTVAALVAALVRFTVQVVLCPLPRVPGEQFRLESCAGAIRLRVKVRVAPPFAVITADWSVVTADTFAVNCVVLDPSGTVTLAGTVTLELLSDSDTANPPLDAAVERVTVQVDVPGAFTVAGVQDKLLSVAEGAAGTIVIVPPEPEVGIELPAALVAEVPLTATGTLPPVAPAAME